MLLALLHAVSVPSCLVKTYRMSTGKVAIVRFVTGWAGGIGQGIILALSKRSLSKLSRAWTPISATNRYGVKVNTANSGPVDRDMYRATGEVHVMRMKAQNNNTSTALRPRKEDVADVVCLLCETDEVLLKKRYYL